MGTIDGNALAYKTKKSVQMRYSFSCWKKRVALLSSITVALIFILGTNLANALSGDLRPANDFHALSADDRKVVVLIHGWNRTDEINKFDDGVWNELILALTDRLKESDWNLQLFDWSHDASTGSLYDINWGWIDTGYDNATQAAINALSLGDQLRDKINSETCSDFNKSSCVNSQRISNLRRIVFIAHSAGSWAAYNAAYRLLHDNPYLVVNVVLLDPFVPGANPNDQSGLNKALMEGLADHPDNERIFRLENYNSFDVTDTPSPFTSNTINATRQTFDWNSFAEDNRHIDSLCVDYSLMNPTAYCTALHNYAYDTHSGPITFYTDTVKDTYISPTPPDLLLPPWGKSKVGFHLSLVNLEELLPKISSIFYDKFAYAKSGDTAYLYVGVEPGINLSYAWYKDGVECKAGARCYSSSNDLNISHTDPALDAGHYVLRIENEYGFTFSDEILLYVSPAIPPPTLDDVQPTVLVGLPRPQTQEITLTGTEFTPQSRLFLFDGTNPPFYDNPIYDGSTQLRYNIEVGTTPATWQVIVDNNGAQTAPFKFYVGTGPQPPDYSPKPAASDGDYSDWVEVIWLPAPEATSFEVYRCTTTLVSGCAKLGSTQLTHFIDYNISSATTYYYRTKACNSIGCDNNYSAYDAGHRGSQNPPPNVSLNASDGLYTNGIVVYWPPVSGATYYQIQRATSLTGTKTTLSSNFTFTTYADTQAVPDRLYYYWVRSCASNGICGAYGDPDSGYRASTAPALQPAINPNPENNDTNVSANLDELGWDNGGGASTYDVYFGTSSTLGSGDYIGSTTSTRRNIPNLNYNTTYYWRVDSKADDQVVPGPVWTFTTRDASLPDIPLRAINPTPTHYAKDVPRTNTVLTWQNGGGATSYDVYFGHNFQPGTAEYVGNTTATSWSLPTLEYDNIYYWKIKARNAGGTAHGDIWKFTVEPSVPDPVIWPLPQDGQIDVSSTLSSLNWSDGSSKALSYDIYFGTDPTPDSGEYVGSSSPSRKSFLLPPLSLNTTYYWQVVSKNNAGTTYGRVWSFTTWSSVPGTLDVSLDGFSSIGPIGGPFTSSTKTYTLNNVGSQALNYTVSNTSNWLQLSQSSGTLQAGEQTTVDVTIGPGANSLAEGNYPDTVVFTNNTGSSLGSTARAVSLTVGTPAQPWDISDLSAFTWGSSAFALRSNGSLLGWGNNQYARFGLGGGAPSFSPAPVLVAGSLKWSKFSPGYSHNLALSTDGKLYAWGDNHFGQLGLGDTVQRTVPTQIGSDSDWIQVSAGTQQSFALKADGRLYSFGEGNLGALGLGDRNDRYVPTQIGTDSDWAYVHASTHQASAIKSDGRLYIWGGNASSSNTDLLVPTQVGTDRDWKVVVQGGNPDFYIALKTDGSLYAWGENSKGQLGLGDFNDRASPTRIGNATDWVAVAAGDSHSMAIKSNGDLYVWGSNITGQLGLGDNVDRNTPIQILQNSEVVAAAGSYSSTYVLLTDGRVLSWGANYPLAGQLGQGHTTRQYFPAVADMNWFVIPDQDGDGIPDASDLDNDNDGVDDQFDAFPLDPYETVDTDGDGTGNNADPDDDNDGLTDVSEITIYSTDPLNPDSDDDGLDDGVETNTGIYIGSSDTGTDPGNPDTDGDSLDDGAEVNTYATDPTLRDSDGDGFADGVEISMGTNPNNINGPWPPADGDLAPLGVYDGVVNVADYLVAQRMALGLEPQDVLAIAHGDLQPIGTSAGIIDAADVLLILQQAINAP